MLRWGKGPIELPAALAGAPRLERAGLEALAEPAEALAAAIEMLVASLDVRSGQRVALVVPDRTRPLDLPSLLPPLLDQLREAGAAEGNLVIVPASGIHRPMSERELAQWTGLDARRDAARLSPHDADAPARLVGTAGSKPVALHPAVANADRVVVLGRVVFHYLAGFGGGRKLIVPGVAARRSVLAMHGCCLERRGGGRHPRARAGVLEGNPVHEASVAMARLAPRASGLHVVLDDAGRLAAVEAGDLVEAHEALARRYADAQRVVVDEPFDALVVSAGGHPVDRDLVQSHKALDAVAPLVRDGGTIVLVARAEEGVGNPEIERALRLGSAAAIRRRLFEEFSVGGHTALALAEKTERFEVLALSELDEGLVELAGMRRVESLEEAMTRIAARHGRDARVALAPRGGALLYELGAGL